MRKSLSKWTDEELNLMSDEDKKEIVYSNLPTASGIYDVALLLGGPLDEMPSRADEVIRLYKNGQVKNIIPTGGVIVKGVSPATTEAEFLRQYLIKNGVSDGDIYKEEQATTTKENMICSNLVMERKFNFNNVKRVVIVTSCNHLKRSVFLAKAYLPKFIEIGGSPANGPFDTPEKFTIDPTVYRRVHDEAVLMADLVRNGQINDF